MGAIVETESPRGRRGASSLRVRRNGPRGSLARWRSPGRRRRSASGSGRHARSRDRRQLRSRVEPDALLPPDNRGGTDSAPVRWGGARGRFEDGRSGACDRASRWEGALRRRRRAPAAPDDHAGRGPERLDSRPQARHRDPRQLSRRHERALFHLAIPDDDVRRVRKRRRLLGRGLQRQHDDLRRHRGLVHPAHQQAHLLRVRRLERHPNGRADGGERRRLGPLELPVRHLCLPGCPRLLLGGPRERRRPRSLDQSGLLRPGHGPRARPQLRTAARAHSGLRRGVDRRDLRRSVGLQPRVRRPLRHHGKEPPARERLLEGRHGLAARLGRRHPFRRQRHVRPSAAGIRGGTARCPDPDERRGPNVLARIPPGDRL